MSSGFKSGEIIYIISPLIFTNISPGPSSFSAPPLSIRGLISITALSSKKSRDKTEISESLAFLKFKLFAPFKRLFFATIDFRDLFSYRKIIVDNFLKSGYPLLLNSFKMLLKYRLK